MRAEYLGMVSHELRAPAGLGQGLRRHRAGLRTGPGPGRDAAVLSDHRRAGRSHAQADRRPAGCGAHRGGHAVGGPRARRSGRPGGPGPEHAPERGRQQSAPDRPAAGPAAGAGGPPAHRAGAGQPAFQRVQALAPAVPDPGHRGPGRLARCDFGSRRGHRHAGRDAAAAVRQVRADRRRGPGAAFRGVRPGPGYLQGAGGGPRGAHTGRERRSGPRHAVHLHDPRGGRGRGSRRTGSRAEFGTRGAGGDARAGRGRRPADAKVRPACPQASGLLHDHYRGPPGGAGPESRRTGPIWSCWT